MNPFIILKIIEISSKFPRLEKILPIKKKKMKKNEVIKIDSYI